MSTSFEQAQAGVRQPAHREAQLRPPPADRLLQAALLLAAALLAAGLLAPLLTLLTRTFALLHGQGFAYLRAPSLLASLWHSTWVSLLVTAIVIPLAFGFACALTRTRMAGRGLLRAIGLLPLLSPSLLPAISMIYWFGDQGLLQAFWHWVGCAGIYGAPGVVLALCLATFPPALMILATALAVSDQRLYEAAGALGAGPVRQFWTVTLPAARFGLVSAALAVFTLAITDFGIPTVIGGNFSMLSTEVYKLVIGPQDLPRGSAAALLLLAPAMLTFVIGRRAQQRQSEALAAKPAALQPRPHALRDRIALLGCGLLSALVLAMFGTVVFASLESFWPYLWPYEPAAIVNSLKLAASAAIAGPVLVFAGAYLLEKTQGQAWLRPALRFLARLPMAVPGLVLGLGYIYLFNAPGNPLDGRHKSMALMVLCTVVHYYASGYMAMASALKSSDGAFEAVSTSLGVPLHVTLRRVTLPMCLPALLEVSRGYFVAAMTTISAVVLLQSPETRLGAVAILKLNEAGDTAAAAAMALSITLICCAATLLYHLLGQWLARRGQRWRQPA